MGISYGSLFSGFGGFDLGFDRAGWECRWQVENNEYATKILAKHWPEVERFGDIASVKELPHVDLYLCGDPCQANSAAASPHGSRSTSPAVHALRLIAKHRPRLVLRENPANVRKDAPWPWWRFRRALERLGYVVLPFRLRACCLGAEHRRERLFLLAELVDANRDGLEGWNGEAIQDIQSPAIPPRLEDRHWPHVSMRGGYRSRNGLPGYVEQVRGLGNAVCPPVAEWIATHIKNSLAPAEPVKG